MKKIVITENHLKLLRNLNWGSAYGFIIGSFNEVEDADVDRQSDLERHEYIDLILNGVPENFDPLNTEEFPEYTDEQKAEWDKLYSELHIVNEVCINRGVFETGTFKTRLGHREWIKID